VDSYRKLTQLQEPVIENIPLKDFVEGIKPLYPQIEWHIHIPEDATWSADKNMLHQVFINLTKNAIEAHASAIDIRCFHKHPESIESSQFSGIYFSNNGAPIPADVAKEMFIPFFSTKPSGSGIGLSISRQMLMMQSITLSLAEHNVAGYHVTFRME
jgi:signal transduction histidine kinase